MTMARLLAGDELLEAPLASMEDLSQLNTPLPTPGPSPRTRIRSGNYLLSRYLLVIVVQVDRTLSIVSSPLEYLLSSRSRFAYFTFQVESKILPWNNYR